MKQKTKKEVKHELFLTFIENSQKKKAQKKRKIFLLW